VLESLVNDRKLAAALYDLESAHAFWQLRNGAPELLSRARQRGLAVLVPRGGDDADQVLFMIANWISS